MSDCVCVQESLRRTAEQYRLANSLLQSDGSTEAQHDDGVHTATGSEDCVIVEPAPSAAHVSSAPVGEAPDDDIADVSGGGCENVGKRKATHRDTHHSCKMQKSEPNTEQQMHEAGVQRIVLIYTLT